MGIEHDVGLGASFRERSVLVVDGNGHHLGEGGLVSERKTIVTWLSGTQLDWELARLEAGWRAHAVYDGLCEQCLPAACLDARQLKNARTAMPVKSVFPS